MFKELQLSWITYPDKKSYNGKYVDFIVSGQPLREYLRLNENTMVTPFGYFENKALEKRILREYRVQQKPLLPTNRIELYLCPACGELGCGGITARIIDKGNKIVWTEFAWQSNEEEISELIEIEEIEFERAAYMRALTGIK